MSLIDRWSELVAVLSRRKLRTALTALSVAWGVFMLVILLAAGNGLANGVQASFAEDAVNSVWINPGVVSKPHRGTAIGKRVNLHDDDIPFVRGAVPAIHTLDARYSARRKAGHPRAAPAAIGDPRLPAGPGRGARDGDGAGAIHQ